jgi:hypothetical protein
VIYKLVSDHCIGLTVIPGSFDANHVSSVVLSVGGVWDGSVDVVANSLAHFGLVHGRDFGVADVTVSAPDAARYTRGFSLATQYSSLEWTLVNNALAKQSVILRSGTRFVWGRYILNQLRTGGAPPCMIGDFYTGRRLNPYELSTIYHQHPIDISLSIFIYIYIYIFILSIYFFIDLMNSKKNISFRPPNLQATQFQMARCTKIKAKFCVWAQFYPNFKLQTPNSRHQAPHPKPKRLEQKTAPQTPNLDFSSPYLLVGEVLPGISGKGLPEAFSSRL